MDGYVRIGTQVDTKDFDAEIKYIESQLEEIEHKLKQADMGFEVGDTQKLEAQYSKLIKQLDRLQKKQADLNKTDLTEVQKNIDKVGNSVSKTISKVGKWALAIFSVRGAYSAVRRAMSTLTQYNETLANQLNTINLMFASALEPLITKIVNLVYKLMSYINYIAKAWFGIDLFASATEKAMSKSAKSAKDMRKSLAGFDEMNVLNDTGTTSASDSIGIEPLPEGEVSSWIQRISEHGAEVIGIIGGIAAAVVALNLGLEVMMGLGIGLLFAGLMMLMQDIIDLIEDPSWTNFLAVLGDIAIVVGAIMLLFGSWWGLLVAGIGLVVKLIAENWEKIKEILGKVGSWIYNNIITPVINFFKAMLDTILSVIKLWLSYVKAIFTTVVNLIANPFIVAKDTIIGVFNGIKTFISGFVQVIKSLFNGDIKGVLDGFKKMFKGVMDSLWTIAKAPINLIIGGINSLIKGMNKIKFDVPDWVPEIGGKKIGFNIPQIPKLALGGIINLPGKGVPIGGAIGGERGVEGVIPLTNTQMMEQLGATIGRYITVNNHITTTLNGRVIGRELKRSENESNFAFNK